MDVKLQKMTFLSVYPKLGDLFDILSANRERLKPWFWWASEKITPNKFRFVLFILLYLANTKRKEIAHNFNPAKLYDESFIVYNEGGKVAGLCGLDNIDTVNKKNAELWGLSFKGNPFGGADCVIEMLEKHGANMNLDSLYAHVKVNNDKSKACLKRNNYAAQEGTKEATVSRKPYRTAPVQVFTKILTKAERGAR